MRGLHQAEHRMVAAVAAGGAVGGLAREAAVRLVPYTTGEWAWVVLLVNASGSFALGGLVVWALARRPPAVHVRAFAGIGVLGAYTTFSAYAVASVQLARAGHPAEAAGYAVTGLGTGLAATWLGLRTGRAVVP